MDIVIVIPSYKRPEAITHLYEWWSKHRTEAQHHGCRIHCVLACSGATYPRCNAWQVLRNPDGRWNVAEARNIAARAAYAAHGGSDDVVYVQHDDDVRMQSVRGYCLAAKKLRENHEGKCGDRDWGLMMPTKGGSGSFDDRKLNGRGFGSWVQSRPYRITYVHPKLIERIGFHDPKYFVREDIDYCIRAQCAGYDTVLCKIPDCNIYVREYGVGGCEMPATGEKADKEYRKQLICKYSELLVEDYPWSSITKDGRYNFQRKLNLMRRRGVPLEEWARYVPGLPVTTP